jgi:hypothetical protein
MLRRQFYRYRNIWHAAVARRRRVEGRKPAEKSRLWVVLNTPVVIWLLSSFIIGLGGAWFTQYQSCRTAVIVNEDKFVKALAEYRFRKIHRDHAMMKIGTKEGIYSARKWAGADSEFLLSEFKDKALADVTLQMLRSFGNLSIYSDISSFDLSRDQLVLDYKNGGRIGMWEPSPGEIAKISKNLLGAPSIQFSQQSASGVNLTSPQEMNFVNAWREELHDGPIAMVAIAAISVRPNPACGPVSIVRRLFRNNDEIYYKQVQYIYGQVLQDFNNAMMNHIAPDLVKEPEAKPPESGPP